MQAYISNVDPMEAFIILKVYVDDCILLNNQLSFIHHIKNILFHEFEMPNEGELHDIMKNVIIKNRTKGWIILHQTKYLTSELQEFGMFESNLINTPLLASVQLSKDDSPITKEELVATHVFPYSRVVGILMHAIVNNRLNCSFAVNSLAQYLSNLGVVHIQALKHVMQYIKGTLTISIKYQKCEGGVILHGFSGVNFGLETKLYGCVAYKMNLGFHKINL